VRKHTVRAVFLLFLLTPTSLLLLIPTTPIIAEKDEAADIIDSLETAGGNEFPIMLIYGAGGFTSDELFGLIDYWGGLRSIPDALRDAGYTVYEVKVGPISSIWDRSVDAFYSIKGGQLDYGAAHSTDEGHNQLSRTLEGIYPEWGELDDQGYMKKVHIIGHSMGGQTARGLCSLLEMVDATQGTSDLFNNDYSDWVASVTSLSACHDGTTLVPLLIEVIDKVLGSLIGVDLPYHIFIAPLAFIAGAIIGENPVYDLMLDHFGIFKQNEDETFFDALCRIFDSVVDWVTSPDFAMTDASPQGAAQVNGWAKAVDDVYYFSYSTTATKRIPLIGYHIPWSLMCPLLYPLAAALGFWTKDDGPIDINKDWCENDGVVNTISMNGPKLYPAGDTDKDEIVNYNPNDLEPGRWNDMGKIKYDHVQILGWFSDWTKVKNFYLDHCALLAQLPKGAQVVVPEDTGIVETIEEINATLPPADPGDNPFTNESEYSDAEYNVTNPEDNPNCTNTDGDMDGMIDQWEDDNGLNSTDAGDAIGDIDLDLLLNSEEYFYGTDPTSADSDTDTIIDSWEIKMGLRPLSTEDGQYDYDVDNLINAQEYSYGTDPFEDDTDGDGYSDGAEVAAGTSPTDPADHPFSSLPAVPPPEDPLAVLLLITVPSIILVAILVGILSLVYLNREKPEVSAKFKVVGDKFRKLTSTLSMKKKRMAKRVAGAREKLSAGLAGTKEKISEIKEKRALKTRSEDELLSEFQDNYIDFEEE